jgi:hypothetical protein
MLNEKMRRYVRIEARVDMRRKRERREENENKRGA